MNRISSLFQKLASAILDVSPLAIHSIRCSHVMTFVVGLTMSASAFAQQPAIPHPLTDTEATVSAQTPNMTGISLRPVWACTGCMGVAGPMVGSGIVNYDNSLWDLSWPTTVSNSRSFSDQGFNFDGVVGIARQPNSPFIYTLHGRETASAPFFFYHLNEVVAATGLLYPGPGLMISPGKPLVFQEGDIAFDPTSEKLYGVTDSGLLFSVPSLSGSSVVVNTLGQLPVGVFSKYTAMAFSPDGTLYVLDSGTSTIVMVNKYNGKVASSAMVPLLYSQAASMNFFGGSTPYVILNGYMLSVDLAARTAQVVGPCNLDRGIVGTLVCTGFGCPISTL